MLLVSVSESFASHAPRSNRRALRHATVRSQPRVVCDPRAPEPPTIRRIVDQTRALGGPIAKFQRRARIDQHPTVSLGRMLRADQNDDFAIQNDTAAADASIDPIFTLRSLGYFVEAPAQQTYTRPTSPRSPRGPPIQA
jgi:hypothetical protein